MKSLTRLFIAAAAPIFFAHCGSSPTTASNPGSDKNAGQTAQVKSTIVLGKVGVLSKSSSINLTKLIVTAVSSATPADTVRDTSSVSGSAQVTVTRTLTLAPLRNWTVTAVSKDAKDSVIHSGSSSSFFVKPADTAFVSLNLSSRYEMYQANFNTLPDSISSSVSGTGKDKLNLNRVTLLVDGVARYDSTLTTGFFTAGQTINLYYDYITPGVPHTVTLEAYGVLHTYSGKLYSGTSSAFTVSAGNDSTQSVTLNWVGPTTGTGKLTVTLGKVGKVTVNGALPGSVIP